MTYLELRDVALGEFDTLVGCVNEQIPVARADAAVALHDFAGWVGEGRGGGHVVCEGAAVAGCVVCGDLGCCMALMWSV